MGAWYPVLGLLDKKCPCIKLCRNSYESRERENENDAQNSELQQLCGILNVGKPSSCQILFSFKQYTKGNKSCSILQIFNLTKGKTIIVKKHVKAFNSIY